MAFTGHYTSSKVIAKFIENLHVELVKSRATTPEIVAAASTLASADFCIPLRIYVGHIHQLIKNHPDLNLIIAPVINSENDWSVTCSKYRDVGGVAIRSLGSMIGYRMKETQGRWRKGLDQYIGYEAAENLLKKSYALPRILQPMVESLDRQKMFNLCYNLYADMFRLPKRNQWKFVFSNLSGNQYSHEMIQVKEAFSKAYEEVVEKKTYRLEQILQDKEKIRLAIVGRNYLVHDSTLSADLKNYFLKKGVAVLTAEDVPYEYIEEYGKNIDGFYDTHKIGQGFIHYALDKVDGFIVVGSFGCHPDAFQVDYLAELIREKGVPCWTFKYDEQAGSAGFVTRYETIYGFLQQRRDERLHKENIPVLTKKVSTEISQEISSIEEFDGTRKPLIIWPNMGATLDILLEEVCYQAGLADYVYLPKPVSEETIEFGNDKYNESCSPFACSIGSLKQNLTYALKELEEPRNIMLLMARSHGPCTFGWYAIIAEKEMRRQFADQLNQYGHTLQMSSMGIHGQNMLQFIKELSVYGNQDRLKDILFYIQEEANGLNKLPIHRRAVLWLKFISAVSKLVERGWVKLLAAEELKAKSLIVRAHELKKGETTRVYKEVLALLRKAHTEQEVKQVLKEGLKRLDSIPQDSEVKPRVVMVGEIYVALTSFANRGTVEQLMGSHGIEVVEGITLSQFIRHSLKELKRKRKVSHPMIKPVLQMMEKYNIYLFKKDVREPDALPFIEHEVGGDGLPSVAHARLAVEQGVDGILHIYPFKCMPEGIARDCMSEICHLYGVRYLSLSFDKEMEIERLKTEVSTFATILHTELQNKLAKENIQFNQEKEKEIKRREQIGQIIFSMYDEEKKQSHLR